MDYYINADTGNDTSGAGTAVSPWATLAKAYTASAAGDTIHFQSSTAHYALVAATMASRTLIGDSAKTCVLDGGGASKVQWNLSGTFSVSNLRFTNVTPWTSNWPFLRPLSAGFVFSFTNCIFDSIGVYDSSSSSAGVLTLFSAGTASFKGCLFYNIYRGTTGSPSTFDCVLGISTGVTATITVTNCTFHLKDQAGDLTQVFSSTTAGGGAFVITNCIIKGEASPTATKLSRNPAAASLISNSCVYGIDQSGAAAIPDGGGNISADPLFVDPANANYNLRPTSPCIDAGKIV